MIFPFLLSHCHQGLESPCLSGFRVLQKPFYLHLTVTLLPPCCRHTITLHHIFPAGYHISITTQSPSPPKSSPTSPPPPLKGRNQYAFPFSISRHPTFCILASSSPLFFLISKANRFSPLGETGERSNFQVCNYAVFTSKPCRFHPQTLPFSHQKPHSNDSKTACFCLCLNSLYTISCILLSNFTHLQSLY